MWLILALLVIIIAIFLFISYTLNYDTVVAFTGGLGSGKTFLSVKTARKLLRKVRFEVWLYNLFHKDKKIKPMLYSSIPVKVSKKEWALELTPEHCLLKTRLCEKAIVFIDEIGAFASQFDFDLPNVKDNFNEFTRLYRQYTKGGYLVVNDQCSENINLYIRRRINTVFNLMHFKKWLGFIYTVRVRNISISEEIKTIEEEDTEDSTTIMFGLIPFFKSYDTYCYSERYNTVPFNAENQFKYYKRNKMLVCPKNRVKKETTDDETLLGGVVVEPPTAPETATN